MWWYPAKALFLCNTFLWIICFQDSGVSIVSQKEKTIVPQNREARQEDLLTVNKNFPLTVNSLLLPFFRRKLISEEILFSTFCCY